MNYTLFLARRLSLGSDGRRVSPAVTVAIIAIGIAVAVMTASIAIVLGFKKEIREKVVGFNGHISIYKVPSSEMDDNLITLTPFLEETMQDFSFIKDYYEQAALPAILKTSDDFKGVYLRGLQGNSMKEYLEKNLIEGEIPDYNEEDNDLKVLISHIASNQLKLKTGDEIETYFMSDDLRVRKLQVAGIYNTHFDQYDDVLMFGDIGLIQKLGNISEKTGTYIVVQTDNFDKIPEYSNVMQQRLNEAISSGETDTFYHIDNVYSQGRGFFSWLSLLDTNVVVIIVLMMIVGCITLVSGMLIIILERKKFIGLMRALGSPASKIRSVFIYMSMKIAFYGIIIGDLAILVLLYFQNKYHFLYLDPDSYYIDFVPVFLPGWIVAVISGGVLFVTYLILVLPSGFVGKISPAESMIRNE